MNDKWKFLIPVAVGLLMSIIGATWYISDAIHKAQQDMMESRLRTITHFTEDLGDLKARVKVLEQMDAYDAQNRMGFLADIKSVVDRLSKFCVEK